MRLSPRSRVGPGHGGSNYIIQTPLSHISFEIFTNSATNHQSPMAELQADGATAGGRRIGTLTNFLGLYNLILKMNIF